MRCRTLGERAIVRVEMSALHMRNSTLAERATVRVEMSALHMRNSTRAAAADREFAETHVPSPQCRS